METIGTKESMVVDSRTLRKPRSSEPLGAFGFRGKPIGPLSSSLMWFTFRTL